LQPVDAPAKAKTPTNTGLTPAETSSRNVEGEFIMSTKINTAIAAAFLALVAAPQIASAQEGFGNYAAAAGDAAAVQSIAPRHLIQVPSDARASVGKVKHRRVYIPSDARGSVVPDGTTEGRPYTPDMQTPVHGFNPDFQDGSRG
jgi:hypothetical protein